MNHKIELGCSPGSIIAIFLSNFKTLVKDDWLNKEIVYLFQVFVWKYFKKISLYLIFSKMTMTDPVKLSNYVFWESFNLKS